MSNKSDDDDKEVEKPLVAKSAADLQRIKLMKLMKNPDKPVLIPERPKQKNVPAVPEFVRNVMGSSAGAGSGEFHVYRHLRRKEYARQKYIQEKGQKELLDEEYHMKLEENKKLAEEATAKKRAKRLKRKQKLKQKKFKPSDKNKNTESRNKSSSEDESSDEEKSNSEDSGEKALQHKVTESLKKKIKEVEQTENVNIENACSSNLQKEETTEDENLIKTKETNVS